MVLSVDRFDRKTAYAVLRSGEVLTEKRQRMAIRFAKRKLCSRVEVYDESQDVRSKPRSVIKVQLRTPTKGKK